MRKPLVMSEDTWLSIMADALSRRPNESCGLLVADDDEGRLIHVEGGGVRYMPVRNTSDDPTRSFVINPDDQLVAAREGRKVVGLVHSHPTGEPRPSDMDQGTYVPDRWWYVIVGLSSGQPLLRVYRRHLGSFVSHQIRVV